MANHIMTRAELNEQIRQAIAAAKAHAPMVQSSIADEHGTRLFWRVWVVDRDDPSLAYVYTWAPTAESAHAKASTDGRNVLRVEPMTVINAWESPVRLNA